MTTQAEKDTQLANLDAVREFIAAAARHAEMPVGGATLYFRYLGVLRSESVIIKAGWQAFTFNYDDLKTTLFVQGI